MNVSILLSCHNSDISKLKRTINSILAQTHDNFELIIIDDGSEIPVSSSLGLFDKRVKVFRLEECVGLGAALNIGLSKATGRYIARIDDDDLMLPNRLALQFDFMENNPDVACVGTFLFFKVGNKVIKYRRFPLETSDIIRDLINLRFSMAHTSVMFRRDLALKFGGYRIKGGGQDLDLFLQLSTLGELRNIGEYLNFYSLSFNGLSVRSPRKKYAAYIFALQEFLKSEKATNFETLINRSISKLQRTSFLGALKLQVTRIILITYVKIFGISEKIYEDK